jgi:hypothetical protein
MRLLAFLQVVALTLSVSGVAAQRDSAKAERYEVVLYEGVPPESYAEELKKDLKPEKPLLSIRVEEGEKFHAEGRGAMFEGKLLSVRGDEVKVRMERSNLASTSAGVFTKEVKLGQEFASTLFGFSSVVHMYYFRVRRAPGE